MTSRFFFSDGQRWRVKEDSRAGVRVLGGDSYVSETPASYSILFVHPITGEERQVDWHKPLSKCTTEDFQLMLEATGPV